MGSSYSESLERLVSQLELEAQLYDNKTARQYLSSLQQYMDTVSLTFVHSKGAPDYETDAGIAWVVAVPFIFFSSVALVMTILLIFFRHSENFKTECKSAEQSHVGADNPLHNSSGNNAESRHDQERAVIIDCHGNSATNKGGAFLRGYVNAAGELEGASRASGASKGSVRSLGVLTDLNDGRLERPQMYGLHSNPPPAPSTLTRHGLTTFEMLARRRLSRSIDELRDLKEGGRQATVPSEWSSLGTIGGRTSLEMNVTSEAPQLTLLESDLATKELPPSKRFSTSIDSLNENASRDSLRASMEFHISKGSGSGLGPDDLYRDRKRKSTGGSKPKSCDRKQEYSLSSSSLDTASRSGSRLGNVNLSFVKSDIDSANSQTESNTYTEILNFDKPHINKSAENVNYVNCVVKQPQRFDNPLFSNSCHQPATCEYAQNTYDNVDNITKRNGTNAMCTAATMTNTVGSNTADIITVGRGLVEPTRQGEKYPERVFPSQTLDSWSSSSDIASSSYRSRSPLRRGRPLSLDILSSWSSDLENQGGRPRLSAPRKPVTRQLFATTPQMAKKRVEDYSLFNDSASRSAPSRKAVANPFNFELKSFVPLNAPRQTTKQVGHPHSKSNTQESSLSFQETAIASAKSEALLKMKTPHSPDSDSFYETKAGKVQSQPIAKKLVERHVYDNPKQRPAIFRKDHEHHKSSLTQLGDAYLTTTSDLSSGASGWTSSGSSEKQRGDLDRTESSADSTIESISSSLAPFHAKRAGEQEMPRAKYRLPQEVRTTDSEPDEGVTSESNTRPELDVSLEPNPGSCNHSLEEATCPQSPVILKRKVQISSQTGGVSARKPPPNPIPRRHGSLMELARNVFSRSSYGPAIAAAAPSSPGQSLGLECSTISAESLSDGILTDRRVTAEQRLSEYGFIKSLAGKSTFVINPSPGKFSGRTGSVKLESANTCAKRERQLFDFTKSSVNEHDSEVQNADSISEHGIISPFIDQTKPEIDSSKSYEESLQNEKQQSQRTGEETCTSCETTEINRDKDWDIIQELDFVDGNNNSLTEEPNINHNFNQGAIRPSVKTLTNRFQQRNNTTK